MPKCLNILNLYRRMHKFLISLMTHDTHSNNEQFDLCNGFTEVIFGFTTIWTKLCIVSNKEVNPLSKIRHSAEYGHISTLIWWLWCNSCVADNSNQNMLSIFLVGGWSTTITLRISSHFYILSFPTSNTI